MAIRRASAPANPPESLPPFSPLGFLSRRWARFLLTFQRGFRSAIDRGDLSTLLITCTLMVIPALALAAALPLHSGSRYWPVSLNQLAFVGIASVMFGYLLARSHVTEIVSLIATGVY